MIANIMKRRVEKILETGTAVCVTVRTCSVANLPPYITLNIGNMLLPNMDLQIDDLGFEADLALFKAPIQRVRVRWESVLKAEPLPRPDPGGGKLNLRAVA
jgi:hypothetical protein